MYIIFRLLSGPVLICSQFLAPCLHLVDFVCYADLVLVTCHWYTSGSKCFLNEQFFCQAQVLLPFTYGVVVFILDQTMSGTVLSPASHTGLNPVPDIAR